MEYDHNVPPPTIDMSAVDIHRPSDERIHEIEALAAQYERSFLTQNTRYYARGNDILAHLHTRALGWRALN